MASHSQRIFRWGELSQVPTGPGIYAWYYVVELTDFDINRAIDEVQGAESGEMKRALLKEFLDRYVFGYFKEDPYKATIWGPLKPEYRGELSHEPEISSALLDRLAQNPDRLRTLRTVLSKAVPGFSSPIYIGMAGNLRSRVLTHKKLIEHYRAGEHAGSGSSREESFARRVVSRKLTPEGLRLTVTEIPSDEMQYVDAENILNRINFPILGRN